MKTLTITRSSQQSKKTNWMKLGMMLCIGLATGVVLATKLEK